jgi:chorismate mutase
MTNTTGTAALDITALCDQIDQTDADILRLVRQRAEFSKEIGAVRMAEGGPRIVYSRELAVLSRYRDLGEDGTELGMLLLRMGRGRLGHP